MIRRKIDILMRKLCLKIFQLDEWFKYNYYDKEYAQYIVKTLNNLIERDKKSLNGYIIEIGCGLGDVIGNIKNQREIKKIGFDKEIRVVYAARLLHPDMRFLKGSFENIKEKKVYCLIIVNLLHFIDPDYAKREIRKLLCNNYVKYVVIDEIRDTKNSSYKYECDGNDILGEQYIQCYKSRRMHAAGGANRHVVIYQNMNLMYYI